MLVAGAVLVAVLAVDDRAADYVPRAAGSCRPGFARRRHRGVARPQVRSMPNARRASRPDRHDALYRGRCIRVLREPLVSTHRHP